MILVMALIHVVRLSIFGSAGTTCFVGGDCRTYLKLARAQPLPAKALASSLVHEGDQNSIFYAHQILAAALPLSFRHDQRGMWSSFSLWNSVATPRDQIGHPTIPSIWSGLVWSDSGDRFVLTSLCIRIVRGGVLPDSRAIRSINNCSLHVTWCRATLQVLHISESAAHPTIRRLLIRESSIHHSVIVSLQGPHLTLQSWPSTPSPPKPEPGY